MIAVLDAMPPPPRPCTTVTRQVTIRIHAVIKKPTSTAYQERHALGRSTQGTSSSHEQKRTEHDWATPQNLAANMISSKC
jgi:hypothetical protein